MSITFDRSRASSSAGRLQQASEGSLHGFEAKWLRQHACVFKALGYGLSSKSRCKDERYIFASKPIRHRIAILGRQPYIDDRRIGLTIVKQRQCR